MFADRTVEVQMSRTLRLSERGARTVLVEEGLRSAAEAGQIVRAAWVGIAPVGRPRIPSTSEQGKRKKYKASIKVAPPRATLRGVSVEVYSDDPKADILEGGARQRIRHARPRRNGSGGGIPVFGGAAGPGFRQTVRQGRKPGRYSARAKRSSASAVRAAYQAGAARASRRLQRLA